MAESLLADREVLAAVSRILQRSEREVDAAQLIRTYVDTGVLPQLRNSNNHILYGRRGTGKTHVLRVLGEEAKKDPSAVVLYLDLRVVGSTNQLDDKGRSLPQKCITLFKDFLGEIHNTLLDIATDPAVETFPTDALGKVGRLAEAITRVAQFVPKRNVAIETSRENVSNATLDAKVGATPFVSAGASSGVKEGEKVAESYEQFFHDNLMFNELFGLLNDALRAVGRQRLLILLDEWTAVGSEIQPYFAEFIKRTLLPNPVITLKIASLEYRSRFSAPLDNNNFLGFELGGDITTSLDLDDYFVYARNPVRVEEIFQELLFKHLDGALPANYFLLKRMAGSASALKTALFTEQSTFVELVRAAEGVARDFIQIFAGTFLDAQRRGRDKIDVRAVREAARQHYEKDKAGNLSDAQHAVLERIIADVIGDKRARSFLLLREHARHPMVESLFDFRVIHLVERGYADKENPGKRYNIYTLDYGTYVDLINTKTAPELGFEEVAEPGDARIVPFDDKRSIRRIILEPNILDTPASSQSK